MRRDGLNIDNDDGEIETRRGLPDMELEYDTESLTQQNYRGEDNKRAREIRRSKPGSAT